MCVYPSCIFQCLNKAEHHSTYANMRRGRQSSKVGEDKLVKLEKLEKLIPRSSKVNWYVVEKMNIKNDFNFRRYRSSNRKIDKNKNIQEIDYISDLKYLKD